MDSTPGAQVSHPKREIAVQSQLESASTRYSFRKGRIRNRHRGRTPALTTLEAAALVIAIIEAQRRDGLSLGQIRWQGYCRDSAVMQLVAKQLTSHVLITEKVSS